MGEDRAVCGVDKRGAAPPRSRAADLIKSAKMATNP